MKEKKKYIISFSNQCVESFILNELSAILKKKIEDEYLKIPNIP